LTCGDGVVIEDGYDMLHFVDGARRTLRVPVGARVVHARLSRDVAPRANWCELSPDSIDDEQKLYRKVPMHPRRGYRPRCERSRGERVLARSEQLLVTQYVFDVDSAVERFCLRSRGDFEFLSESLDSGGATGSYVGQGPFAAAGTRVAWGTIHRTHWPEPDSTYRDTAGVELLDLARGYQRAPTSFAAMLGPLAGAASPDVSDVAVAPDGTLAWLAGGGGGRQLNARLPGRQPFTVTAITTDVELSDLEIAPDRATVTWREDGVERSAPLAG
jgi:hypothetical protein